MIDVRRIELAEKLADAAGEIVLKYFRGDIRAEYKESASPIVTIADTEIEAELRNIIMKDDPESGIIGEEFGLVKGKNGYTWILDPIDGTIAFSTGKPLFATLIGLFYDDKPELGVIDQAYTRERWVGLTGVQSKLNGVTINSASETDLKKCKLSTTSPGMFQSDEEKEIFGKLSNSVHITSYGGDAYQYALCAMGNVDIVIEKYLSLHDWAALVPVIKGAGGIITDWKGNELVKGSSGDVIVTGNPILHDKVLSLINL